MYSCPLAFVTSQKDHRAPSFPLPAARERERVCVCVCVCVCAREREKKREKESARSKRSVEKEEEEEGVREKNWISIKEKKGDSISLLSTARDVPRLLHGVRVELRSPGYRG